jgi:hypothetical protein
VRQYEVIATALLEAGWPPDEIIAVFTVVESFVMGSVLDLVAPVQMVQPADGEEYPLLRSLLGESADVLRAQHTFELGIETMIDGLRRRLERVAVRPV